MWWVQCEKFSSHTAEGKRSSAPSKHGEGKLIIKFIMHQIPPSEVHCNWNNVHRYGEIWREERYIDLLELPGMECILVWKFVLLLGRLRIVVWFKLLHKLILLIVHPNICQLSRLRYILRKTNKKSWLTSLTGTLERSFKKFQTFYIRHSSKGNWLF